MVPGYPASSSKQREEVPCLECDIVKLRGEPKPSMSRMLDEKEQQNVDVEALLVIRELGVRVARRESARNHAAVAPVS